MTHPSALLLVVILIVRLLQNDSPADGRDDWLTRPISWLALLTAKAAFMLLWLAVPDAVGGTVKALNEGYWLGAALLEGARQSVPSPGLIVVIAASIITSSLWQASLALGAAWLAQWALVFIDVRLARTGVFMEANGPFIGTLWVQHAALGLLAILAGALILWQQYGRRKTGQARASYAGALALAFLVVIALLPARRTFAVQRWLASAAVAVELAPGCFASKSARSYTDILRLRDRVALQDGLLAGLLRTAGANPVIFSTVLTERERAGADRMMFAHAQAKYVDAAGRPLVSVRGFAGSPQLSTAASGRAATTHYWVLSRADYAALAARSDVRLQIDYSWSLLVPKARAVVPINGQLAFYPGLGHCGAYPQDPANYVLIDCSKKGPQPALLYVKAVGSAAGVGATSGLLDFSPAFLSWFAEGRRQLSWAPDGARPSQVQVIAYQALTHSTTRFLASGILGGPTERCPAPAASGIQP